MVTLKLMISHDYSFEMGIDHSSLTLSPDSSELITLSPRFARPGSERVTKHCSRKRLWQMWCTKQISSPSGQCLLCFSFQMLNLLMLVVADPSPTILVEELDHLCLGRHVRWPRSFVGLHSRMFSETVCIHHISRLVAYSREIWDGRTEGAS